MSESEFAIWVQGRYMYVKQDGGFWITMNGSGKLSTPDLYKLFLEDTQNLIDPNVSEEEKDRGRFSRNWASGSGFI